VVRTRVGYCGGTLKDPTYHNLGDHTESIQVDFDPTKLTYGQILDRIWVSHNPCATAWSRQYMSAIFYEGEAQKKAILESKAKMEQKLGRPVKTAILPLTTFWLAEDYHQKYELRSTGDLMKEFKVLFPNEKDFLNSTAAARVNGYIGGQGTAQQLKSEIDLLGLSEEGKKRLQAYVSR
jgi:methionine-S-sulfoxide reductase